MSGIFHDKLAEDGYTRFWLMIVPLFALPFVGVSIFLFLIWRELRKIRKENLKTGGRNGNRKDIG